MQSEGTTVRGMLSSGYQTGMLQDTFRLLECQLDGRAGATDTNQLSQFIFRRQPAGVKLGQPWEVKEWAIGNVPTQRVTLPPDRLQRLGFASSQGVEVRVQVLRKRWARPALRSMLG